MTFFLPRSKKKRIFVAKIGHIITNPKERAEKLQNTTPFLAIVPTIPYLCGNI